MRLSLLQGKVPMDGGIGFVLIRCVKPDDFVSFGIVFHLVNELVGFFINRSKLQLQNGGVGVGFTIADSLRDQVEPTLLEGKVVATLASCWTGD